MNRLLRKSFFLSLLLGAVCSAQPALFPAYMPGKAGFINRKGEIIIPLQFDIAGDFSEGLARIAIGEKYGYVDETGKVVIAPQFSDARDFSEGLARVQVGGDKYGRGLNAKWGFIDKTGKFVIEPQYGELRGVAEEEEGFQDGLALVEIDYKKGFIDKTGKLVIFPIAAYGHHFTEGLACGGGLDGGYGCIDKTGRYVIEPIYDDLSFFSEGLNDGKIHGKCVYIDRQEKSSLRPSSRTMQKVIAQSFREHSQKVLLGGASGRSLDTSTRKAS